MKGKGIQDRGRERHRGDDNTVTIEIREKLYCKY